MIHSSYEFVHCLYQLSNLERKAFIPWDFKIVRSHLHFMIPETTKDYI